MKHRRIYLALGFLLLVATGCNLPSKIKVDLTETVTSIPTEVSQVESADTPQKLLTETPQAELPETLTPTVEANQPFIPIGFITTSEDGGMAMFYDLSGNMLGLAEIPGFNATREQFHIAGPFWGNPDDVPLVYLTFENMGNIKQSLGTQVSTVFPGPDAVSLIGAPGQNAYVYTTVTWTGDTLDSYFYLKTVSSDGDSWIWERVDPESWAMKPLSLIAENNEAQHIFFTLEPYGIGGDIVFPPRKGLFQLELENLETGIVLTQDFNPIGLSLDAKIVAYTAATGGTGGQDQSGITLHNLTSGLIIPVDLAPGTDRGGGYAVFSQDNAFVAWMEASGWLLSDTPDFHTRVRIAKLEGTIITDIPDIDLATLAGDPSAVWTIPSAWLDNETLLVEVRGENWNNPALVSLRFDGSGMNFLASGKFLGLLYP